MKIELELSPKSIQNAIKELKRIEKLLKSGKIMREFFEFVCKWVIDRANQYIDNADLGSVVKETIKNAWKYTITENGATITNDSQPAVFVEFGVGIVGQGKPHDLALEQGYEYNRPRYIDGKPTKDQFGMWYFWTNSNELDLPKSSLEDIRGYDDFRGASGKRIIVGTRGAVGVMYAYNATRDAQEELKNPNGELAQKWQKLLKEYIG